MLWLSKGRSKVKNFVRNGKLLERRTTTTRRYEAMHAPVFSDRLLGNAFITLSLNHKSILFTLIHSYFTIILKRTCRCFIDEIHKTSLRHFWRIGVKDHSCLGPQPSPQRILLGLFFTSFPFLNFIPLFCLYPYVLVVLKGWKAGYVSVLKGFHTPFAIPSAIFTAILTNRSLQALRNIFWPWC